MENEFRDRQRKSYVIMRMIYDITMALLFIGMAVVMFFAEKLKIDKIITFDSTFRYMFGAICLLYGGFRLYRGFKRDY